MPPPARLTGRVIRRSKGRACGRWIARRSPCSINAVRVVPRRAASSFACVSRPSSKRTVVLICPSIRLVCLYVKILKGEGRNTAKNAQVGWVPSIYESRLRLYCYIVLKACKHLSPPQGTQRPTPILTPRHRVEPTGARVNLLMRKFGIDICVAMGAPSVRQPKGDLKHSERERFSALRTPDVYCSIDYKKCAHYEHHHYYRHRESSWREDLSQENPGHA